MGINVDPAKPNGNEIQLQPKDESSSDGQKWVREQDVGNGWFPLKNPNSGKILSALNESSLVARGKHKSMNGMILLEKQFNSCLFSIVLYCTMNKFEFGGGIKNTVM